MTNDHVERRSCAKAKQLILTFYLVLSLLPGGGKISVCASFAGTRVYMFGELDLETALDEIIV